TFRTPEEQPSTDLGSPDDGAEVASGDVTLRATPSDPEGDELDAQFRRGFTYTVDDDEVTVATGTTPDTSVVDRSALPTTDGLEEVSSEGEFPFQLFTVDVPEEAGDDFTARLHWKGSANAGAKIVM